MYLLVLYFPLCSFLSCILFSRFFGSKGSSIISIFFLFCTVCTSLFIFYEVGLSNSICTFSIFVWFDIEYLLVDWGFLFDSLTSIMLLVVTIISLLVHIFSVNYMENDPFLSRFLSYLSLFTFFMLILITSDNFVQMFVGWEGVGLASYLLINFWFTRYQANKSAIKAIIVNRIGDFGLLIGISLIFYYFGTLNFAVIFSLTSYFQYIVLDFFSLKIELITLISLFLFVGAVGKSAQLGLHIWLPDAMEGPTPVSALIHAATMVTAGVFVIIRCSPLIEYSKTSLMIISIVGALTAFFAATTGLLQNDLKRVIAYSTCSQLGYMVFACGLSNYTVSLFHLMNHAFFKALLFLSAGAVIHAMADEQDLRKMGGLVKILPFTYLMILIGSLALMGFPFLTGFYSKDVILELTFASFNIYSTFCYWLGTLSAFFTAFYSFRLIFLTFIVKTNSYKKIIEGVHEAPILMTFSMVILSFGSIFVGFLMKDLIIGLGSNFWLTAIFYMPSNSFFIDAEFLPVSIKLIPVIFSFLGLICSFFFYILFFEFNFFLKNNQNLRYIYTFLNQKWFFDQIIYFLITKPLLLFGYNISFKLLDRGFIEFFGPLTVVRVINLLSLTLNKLQSGFIYNYIYLMLLSFVIFSLIFIFNFLFYINIKLLLILIVYLIFFNTNKKENKNDLFL